MANKAIGTLAVGSSVYLNVGGVRKEFLVVHQGLPSSLYDASCDGTWLLMKDCYENRQWNSSNFNVYETSTVNTYLNGPFLSLFDSNIQGIIKQVKIPYRKNGGSGGTDQSGANGLSAKIFLLSGYEVGFTTSDFPYFPIDGAKLSYFESGTGASAKNKRIAYLNGSAALWWLRSPDTSVTDEVLGVYSDGDPYNRRRASLSLGIRPALILPSTTLVDDSGNVVTVDLTAHKTLINGTAYTVKGGKCLVNGTVYNILKGRTLIDGTGWDITFPSAGTKLSTLYVGQSVYLNVGGVRKEFLVVHQGLPSSLYDASCDGTWLLLKDIYEIRQWHSPNINSYKESAIHSYLNSTFLNLFESNIQAAIKQVKIPYVNEAGSSAVASGANGLSCKVFLLSGYEVGIGGKTYLPQDGAKLSYFNLNIGMDPKRIAYLNGSAAPWWLRSPSTNSVYYAWNVNSGGGCDNGFDVGLSFGIRPCIILPSDALVDEEYNLIA